MTMESDLLVVVVDVVVLSDGMEDDDISSDRVGVVLFVFEEGEVGGVWVCWSVVVASGVVLVGVKAVSMLPAVATVALPMVTIVYV